MKFNCPYCGKNYEIENGNPETDDLVFKCMNCGKFVGIFHKVEIARKLDNLVILLNIFKYFFMVIFGLIFIFIAIFGSNSLHIGQDATVSRQFDLTQFVLNLLFGVIALVFWHMVTSIIIYRMSALSFQMQKQFEQVELQKYLIGQVKK